MCNSIHYDHTFEAIPQTGIGYKLFKIDWENKLIPFCGVSTNYQNVQNDGTVSWVLGGHAYRNSGFCFFMQEPTENEFNHILREFSIWSLSKNLYTIAKIRYSDVLGSHIERHFIGGEEYRIAICRTFRLHDDVKYTL